MCLGHQSCCYRAAFPVSFVLGKFHFRHWALLYLLLMKSKYPSRCRYIIGRGSPHLSSAVRSNGQRCQRQKSSYPWHSLPPRSVFPVLMDYVRVVLDAVFLLRRPPICSLCCDGWLVHESHNAHLILHLNHNTMKNNFSGHLVLKIKKNYSGTLSMRIQIMTSQGKKGSWWRRANELVFKYTVCLVHSRKFNMQESKYFRS